LPENFRVFCLAALLVMIKAGLVHGRPRRRNNKR
jgi:hypothetical protein